ncbi:TetR/AcrR family transcriptional regulator [Nannocystaceae bacterium ST9]
MSNVPSKPSKPATARRKQPRQDRSKLTVDAILEATERVLASRGLEATTTTEVAEIAGVSVGTLYQYFPNKQALVAAVIEARLDRDLAAIDETLARARALPLREGLQELARTQVRLYGSEPALYREMVAALAELERARRVELIIEHTIAGLAELLAARPDEHDHPEPEIAAWVMVHNGVQLMRAAVRERPELLLGGKLFAELERMGGRYLGMGMDPEPEP